MYIDLSISLKPDLPVYPGDPKLTIDTAGAFAEEGYLGHQFCMGNHVGTHIDAEAHLIEGGRTLAAYELHRFIGRCVYVDKQTATGSDFSNIDVRAGDVVVVDMGMAKFLFDKAYYSNYPVISDAFADYLIGKQASMICLDTCSIDNQEGFPLHKKILSAGILVAENLTNISQLEGKEATIIALPLKLDLDAAPARIIAEVQ